MKTFFLSAMAALSLSAASFATETRAEDTHIFAQDPDSFARFFEAEGIDYEFGEDNLGDPMFELTRRGTEYTIFFYGCDDNVDCNAIQFNAGYITEGDVRMRTVNRWNLEERYTRAYVDAEDDVMFEYDVFLGQGGLSYEDFDNVLRIWNRSLRDFENHIDW